jgi:hypothetical protein
MAELNSSKSGIVIDEKRLKKLRKTIRTLPEKVAKRRVLVGLTRALKVTRDAAKADVPVVSGALRKSLHVVRGRRSTETSPYVVLRINPKTQVSYTDGTGMQVTRVPRTYYHVLAYGTKGGIKKTKKGGFAFNAYDDDGRVIRVKKIDQPQLQGNDYIGDAWDRTKSQVRSQTLDFIIAAIEEHKRKNGIP